MSYDYQRPSCSRDPTPIMPSQSNTAPGDIDKLALKCDYLNLLEETDAIGKCSDVIKSLELIDEVMNKADALFPRVHCPAEMLLDAQVIDQATTHLEQAAQNIDVGEGTFNLFLFAEQFKKKAQRTGLKAPWQALYAAAEPVVQNSIPHWTPLLGSFEFTVEEQNQNVEKKKRKQRIKDVEAEKREPEKDPQIEKTEGVPEIVSSILVKLKKHFRENHKEPINYFRFVIDPTCFSQTVENIFHVSFLINDHFAKLDIVNEEPVISPILKGKENENPANQSRGRERKQNIISIDMDAWMSLISVLDIKKAMI